MRETGVRRLGRGAEMAPAVARIGVRRLRRHGRSSSDRGPTWATTTPLGELAVSASRSSALLDGSPVGRFSCRIDRGTSTAECESSVPAALAVPLVDLVVASVGSGARRVAWFVPAGDAALEAAVSGAGFACEGWAAPPVGDLRPHRQWALLTADR